MMCIPSLTRAWCVPSHWMAAASALEQHQSAPIELADTYRHAIPLAIERTLGTLLVLDRRGLAWKRTWFLYEAYLAVRARAAGSAQPKHWDLYTPLMHSTLRVVPPRTCPRAAHPPPQCPTPTARRSERTVGAHPAHTPEGADRGVPPRGRDVRPLSKGAVASPGTPAHLQLWP